jgi:hypothetical protein
MKNSMTQNHSPPIQFPFVAFVPLQGIVIVDRQQVAHVVKLE